MKKQRWVVKIGSGLLTDIKGKIDFPQIQNFSRQIAWLKEKGFQVLVVTSGAISCGMTQLGLTKRPQDLSLQQACATIGQPQLMAAYQKALEPFGLFTAQILLTSWDLDSRRIYNNARSTVEQLLKMKNCIPVFNENDALSFDEIEMINTFGDNDRLSAHVATLVDATKLVLLSTVDGLYTKADTSGTLIKRVSKIDEKISSYAGKTQSERSVGGMISKIEAAKLVMEKQIPMVIAHGRTPDILITLGKGKSVGTHFHASPKR